MASIKYMLASGLTRSLAFYGLHTSAQCWRAYFAEFILHSMGFASSRFDHDVWLRERNEKDWYDYTVSASTLTISGLWLDTLTLTVTVVLCLLIHFSY
jgi:hypothetical protein